MYLEPYNTFSRASIRQDEEATGINKPPVAAPAINKPSWCDIVAKPSQRRAPSPPRAYNVLKPAQLAKPKPMPQLEQSTEPKARRQIADDTWPSIRVDWSLKQRSQLTVDQLRADKEPEPDEEDLPPACEYTATWSSTISSRGSSWSPPSRGSKLDPSAPAFSPVSAQRRALAAAQVQAQARVWEKLVLAPTTSLSIGVPLAVNPCSACCRSGEQCPSVVYLLVCAAVLTVAGCIAEAGEGDSGGDDDGDDDFLPTPTCPWVTLSSHYRCHTQHQREGENTTELHLEPQTAMMIKPSDPQQGTAALKTDSAVAMLDRFQSLNSGKLHTYVPPDEIGERSREAATTAGGDDVAEQEDWIVLEDACKKAAEAVLEEGIGLVQSPRASPVAASGFWGWGAALRSWRG